MNHLLGGQSQKLEMPRISIQPAEDDDGECYTGESVMGYTGESVMGYTGESVMGYTGRGVSEMGYTGESV